MCKSLAWILAATFAIAASALATAAAAEEKVAIGDLSKAGYSCREVGEARHLCTRGEKDPTYGCEQHDCKVIGLRAGSAAHGEAQCATRSSSPSCR